MSGNLVSEPAGTPDVRDIRYRPFHNVDPPYLIRLWHQAGDQRGLTQPLSALTLESEVFAKPYFDPEGLIVAERDGQRLGFVHAGFGSGENATEVQTDLGVIAMMLVPHQPHHHEIEEELLRRAESYLTQRGAQVIYGGQMQPLNPFYFGLYGGSELGGVLSSDQSMTDLFARTGYQECARSIAVQRELFGFRPPVDRRFMQHRRQYQVVASPSRAAEFTWWQACQLANTECTEFRLVPRSGGAVLGEALIWNMEAASRMRGVASVGLLSLQVDPKLRHQGLGLFLVADTLRQLQEQAVKMVVAQTMHDNTIARAFYQKLGFAEVDEGVVYRRAPRT